MNSEDNKNVSDKKKSELPKVPKFPKKDKKFDKKDEIINELTADLQRLRADFENYRKRVELDKAAIKVASKNQTIAKLLPVIDNISRATEHAPKELVKNDWANGVLKLPKLLFKDLEAVGVSKIDASEGAVFNPEIHEAVQMDEDSEGDVEVVASELQAGYMVDGVVLRPAMVRVTRK